MMLHQKSRHPTATAAFSQEDRQAVYRAIETRRDVRDQFLSDPLPDALFMWLLRAAHHAPSVGFMQPSNFITIRDAARREAIWHILNKANEEDAEIFPASEERLIVRLNWKTFARRR